MYNAIYTAMVRGGVAKEIDECVYQDREGNIVLEDDPK
jgi:hypothetical protein